MAVPSDPRPPANDPVADDPVRLVVDSGPGVSLAAYFGGVPANTVYAGDRVLTWEQPAAPSPHRAPLRAAVRRGGERMPGCLGAEFTPAPDGSCLSVVVHVRDVVPAGSPRAAYDAPGLEGWAGEGVLAGVRRVARSSTIRALGAGRLEIRWGWQHDIDSSQLGFSVLATQLVAALGLPRTATREDFWAACNRTHDTAAVTAVLDYLDVLRARHPAAGTFGPGASEGELAALTLDLGLPLPEALVEVLRRVNGATFDPDAVPARPPTAGQPQRAWCRLLGVDEIRAAYADLIATHEADAAVERWEGSWPVRARYRPREGGRAGDPVLWPFIPVARTDNGEVLVLHASGPDGNGPVLDAFHEVGPRQWRQVYVRFAALFEDFVAEAGEVRTMASP